MKSIFEPANEGLLRQVEQELRMPLTPSYRRFLCSTNGIKFAEPISLIPKHRDKVEQDDIRVTTLLGVTSDGGRYSLVDAQEDYGFYRRVPSNIICIGLASYRLRICLSLAGEDNGRVYLWTPFVDWVEDDYQPSYEELTPIFDSFDEFASSLGIELRNTTDFGEGLTIQG